MQTLIVAMIVLAAAAYMGSRWLRTLRSARPSGPASGPGCGSDCGCGK